MFNLGKRWILIIVYIYAIIFSLSGYALSEPLHDVAKEGSLEKVTRLVEEGSNVNIRTDTGVTPLHFAAYRGHKDVAEWRQYYRYPILLAPFIRLMRSPISPYPAHLSSPFSLPFPL